MTVHVLVEGTSDRVLLEKLVLRLSLSERVRVHPHQGKGDLPEDLTAQPKSSRRGLLDQLPAKLRAFARSRDSERDAVIVVIDADDDDQRALRKRIEEAAKQVSPDLRVFVRLAVEETEAFYLGDLRGLKRAYPQADMHKARRYEPDSICGTSELFGEVVGDPGLNKVSWAGAMGPVLTTKERSSRSPSYRDLLKVIHEATKPAAKPLRSRKSGKYRHRPKPRNNAGRRR
jgi:hypothetical protein